MSFPAATRSKALVCGQSVSGVAGSNPAGNNVFLCFVPLVLSDRGFVRRDDYSLIGVTQAVFESNCV